ncbi:integral membrane [Fusarium albosuccineum]|uniref:Integral membrane n=1 Tax=Fusarium albosuccineum TaxID=1237068 RepID=A0A8H4LHD6_9HYPO|nr:integral membrane [Fusarium albosuccineum]
MPVFEERPSFLVEAWTLYGIGTLILLTRFAVRFKTVGLRGLQGDDFFSVLVLIFYAMDAFTVHLIYFLGTNIEAEVYALTHTLTDKEIAEFIKGSKLEFVAWYSYTALIWSLKGTMLCFFRRMTIGTWHNMFVKSVSIISVVSYTAVFLTITFGCFPTQKNWQVVPDPGEKCTFKMQNLLVTTVLNVLKLVIGLLLSSGLFVISAAIIRASLTLSSNPSAITINSWGVRETIVGIITVNIPILRPMFSKSFWTMQPNSHISSTFRTTTGGGKSTDNNGPYELTPSINEGSRPSDRGSEESIIGQGRQKMAAVVVETTYDVTRDQRADDEDWYGDGRGQTKASVQADSPV